MIPHTVMIVDDSVLFPDDMDTMLEKILHERFAQIAQVNGKTSELEQRIAFWKQHINIAGQEELMLDAFRSFNHFCKYPVDLNRSETFNKKAYCETLEPGNINDQFDEITWWGDVPQKILKLIGEPSWRFISQQNDYYNDAHHNLDESPEKNLCVTSKQYRPAAHTVVNLCHYLWIDAIPDLLYFTLEPIVTFEKPGDIVRYINNYFLNEEIPLNEFLYVTKDLPSEDWKELGVNQIVLAPGAALQKKGNVHIAGSFEDVLSLTTEHVEGEERGYYLAPGIVPRDPRLN